MTNPFPFTAGDVLNAADLNAIGETETWMPTFQSGVTVGNGTLSGYYQRVNDFVIVQGSFELGSTSAITGDVRVTVPVAASDFYGLSVGTTVQFLDVSTTTYWSGSGRVYGASAVRLRALLRDTGNNYVAAKPISSTAPFTWATGDRINWTQTYRVGS